MDKLANKWAWTPGRSFHITQAHSSLKDSIFMLGPLVQICSVLRGSKSEAGGEEKKNQPMSLSA